MAHVNVAVSEKAFAKLFVLFRDSFRLEDQQSKDFGPFRLGYHVKAHLENGEVELDAAGEVQVRELDLEWDKFEISLGLDIPGFCVGGGCVDLPWPLPDFCLPEWCVFEGDPDVEIKPDIAAFVRKMEKLYELLHETSRATNRAGILKQDLSFLTTERR